jgi:hypothetical protein
MALIGVDLSSNQSLIIYQVLKAICFFHIIHYLSVTVVVAVPVDYP